MTSYMKNALSNINTYIYTYINITCLYSYTHIVYIQLSTNNKNLYTYGYATYIYTYIQIIYKIKCIY